MGEGMTHLMFGILALKRGPDPAIEPGRAAGQLRGSRLKRGKANQNPDLRTRLPGVCLQTSPVGAEIASAMIE